MVCLVRYTAIPCLAFSYFHTILQHGLAREFHHASPGRNISRVYKCQMPAAIKELWCCNNAAQSCYRPQAIQSYLNQSCELRPVESIYTCPQKWMVAHQKPTGKYNMEIHCIHENNQTKLCWCPAWCFIACLDFSLQILQQPEDLSQEKEMDRCPILVPGLDPSSCMEAQTSWSTLHNKWIEKYNM